MVYERKSLVETLMEMEEYTREEAEREVAACRADLRQRLADGEMPDDILKEWFGLEPDWLDELI